MSGSERPADETTNTGSIFDERPGIDHAPDDDPRDGEAVSDVVAPDLSGDILADNGIDTGPGPLP